MSETYEMPREVISPRIAMGVLAREVEELRAALATLTQALKTARDTIRIWHGMDGGTWEIYNQNSPEMKEINAALAKIDAAEQVLVPPTRPLHNGG